jgi:hypothetical protein
VETMDPATLQAVLQMGGAPVAAIIAAKYFLQGSTEKMEKMEAKLDRMHDTIHQIDRRLVTMEVEARLSAAPD